MAVVPLLYTDLLLGEVNPLAGLQRVLRHLAQDLACDGLVVRADGSDGLVAAEPPVSPDGAAPLAHGSRLTLPVTLYDLRLGEVTAVWRRPGAATADRRQRLAAAVPVLGLGLCLAGGVGSATSSADLAEANLLTTNWLAAGMAHELNNLLTALGFQLEQLLDVLPADPPQLQALQRVVDRGGELAAALMDLSRPPERGQWCDIDTLVRRSLLYARSIWFGRHVQVTVDALPAGVLVPAATAELAMRWSLRYAIATAPRGWSAALRVHPAGDDRLQVLLGPAGGAGGGVVGDAGGHVPGAGLGADADPELRALRALLAAVGGELGVASGPQGQGPQLAIWMPMRRAAAATPRGVAQAWGT